MNRSNKDNFHLTGLLLFIASLLFLCACSGTFNLYKGQTATFRDQIPLSLGNTHYGVWKTSDLSVYYTWTGLPHLLNLSGDVVISKHIVSSYPRLESLLFRVSFLDETGKVINTRNIVPVYRANSAIPEKFPFSSESELLPGTVAIAFSYRARFRDYGEDRSCTYDIERTPFTKEPEASSE